jgi:hypothetical protein
MNLQFTTMLPPFTSQRIFHPFDDMPTTPTRIRKPREAETAPRAGTPHCAGSGDLHELQIPGHHARDWWMRFQVLGGLDLAFVFECLEGEGWLGRKLVI